MLLWALYPGNPYQYYRLLRVVCCGVFVYFAVESIGQKKKQWTWAFGIIAAIYNPLFPLHLTRLIWSSVNIFTICLLLTSPFLVDSKLALRQFARRFDQRVDAVLSRVGQGKRWLVPAGLAVVFIIVPWSIAIVDRPSSKRTQVVPSRNPDPETDVLRYPLLESDEEPKAPGRYSHLFRPITQLDEERGPTHYEQ